MNKTKVAKELLKIANDLFEDESNQTISEHDIVAELIKKCSASFGRKTIIVYLGLKKDLITDLDYYNLKFENIEKIVIQMNLNKGATYNIKTLRDAIKNADLHSKKIKREIKKVTNVDVDIELICN
jgi:hypothetical protein